MRTVGWVIAIACACTTDPPEPRGEPTPAQPEPARSVDASEIALCSTPASTPAPTPTVEPDRGPSSVPNDASATPATSTNPSTPASPGSESNPVPETTDPAPPTDIELRAADGVTVYGQLYAAARAGPRPIVLLFHQAGSNAAEYAPIAPRLQALGYHALAIDQRSGKRRFGRKNLTVEALGKSTGFGLAYRDLKAALAWAQPRYPTVLAWGSSYSAALVFRLAAEHPGAIAAVLAFSPGEYLGGKGKVAGWARTLTVPVFVTSGSGRKEIEQARGIAEAVAEHAEQHVPTRGIHGASTLHPTRNPAGHDSVWAAVEAFLQRVHADASDEPPGRPRPVR